MNTLFLSIFRSMAMEIGEVQAIVMQDVDGETVVKYVRDGLDPLEMEIQAAQWGLLWKMAAEKGPPPARMIFVTQRQEVVIETLDPEFYLIVLLPGDGPVGRTMEVVHRYLPVIHDEMGF